MDSQRLPVLLEDGSSLDWSEASYNVEVTLRRGGARVEHELTAAAGLQALIEDGCAAWATELRCPRTLLSRLHTGESSRQEVNWREDEIAGDVYLVPGLVAVRNAVLSPSLGIDREIWPTAEAIVFPPGQWLAKGEVRSITPLLVSLVRFARDTKGMLDPGQMSVEEASDGTAPYFQVTLAAQLYERRESRDIQIAGLIAALGRLPRSSLGDGGPNSDSQIAGRLRAEFEYRGLPDWDDEENFDPALAATALEPFHMGDVNDIEDD